LPTYTLLADSVHPFTYTLLAVSVQPSTNTLLARIKQTLLIFVPYKLLAVSVQSPETIHMIFVE
jgi:hypothetical protein